MHLLFVCTGNICRSPIAERLANAYCAELNIQDCRSSSAGTRAVIGHPIHAEAAHVLREMGGDASDFKARQLTAKVASKVDLVLTMTKEHRSSFLEVAPHKLHSTFTLSEAAQLVTDQGARTLSDLVLLRPLLDASAASDIPDPIGQSPEVFAHVGERISALLKSVLGCFQTAEA